MTRSNRGNRVTEDAKVTIIRAPRDVENPYFLARRATAQDESLSFAARGLLIYLLSKPSTWRLQVADLQRAGGGIGRDQVYRLLAELTHAGYMTRTIQREHGKWAGTEYQVYEVPQAPVKTRKQQAKKAQNGSPHTEKPDTVSPDTEKPDTEKPDTDFQETLYIRESERIENLTEKRAVESAAAGAEEKRPNVFAVYEKAFGLLVNSSLMADELKDMASEYPPAWIEDAFRETALNGVKSLKYARAILERWNREGKPSKEIPAAQPQSPAPKASTPETPRENVVTPEEQAELIAALKEMGLA